MKTKIKNVCTVVAGGTPSTKNKDFWNGTISWITPLDLSKNKGIFISYGERNISKKGLSSCSATLFPKNSVIMSTRAPIGLLAIPTLDKTCTNQGCKTIVCGNSVNNKWLYYYLALLTTKLNFLGNGTTFKEISKENLENLVIDLPPKEQQQHIVDIK